ncbi:MAG: 16S rRNA (cytidine(1402)-2'-O)-methyltransferase [Armatimonadaceae bacterium]
MAENTAPAPGVLYLVATPIGNLEDITARALRILREVSLIAAEDTRVTRKLLAHFDIHTPLTSYYAHSQETKTEGLIARLLGGDSVALVSDAGTPCISDPGAELVAEAVAAGVRVEPIPGACAAVAGLIGSGLPPARFVFEGFLPRTNDRQERLKTVTSELRTVILYESSPRLVSTLEDLQKLAGADRLVAVGRELTKKFEEFVRGTLPEVIAHYNENPPKGECVIVLAGASEAAEPADAPDIAALARAALAQGLSPRDAAKQVAKEAGIPRNEAYAVVQAEKGGFNDFSGANSV